MESGRAIGLRLARRDESALEDAYAAYGPSLLAYLRRYVGPDEAEDVLQRTFLDVWRHAPRYQPTHRFSTWVFTIAHRRAIDTLRTRRHQVVDVEAARDLVRAALARLPEHERQALELTYYAGLTQREVAAHLDVPIGTVKARTSRGTRRLGALMRAQLREGGVA